MARTLIRNITGITLNLPLPYGGVLPGNAATVVTDDEQTVINYLGGPAQIRFIWDVFPVNENTPIGPYTLATGALQIARAVAATETDIAFNSRKLTSVATPTNASDAATKGYVDGADAGKVPTTRAVDAGFAMTGGGQLSADVTLGFAIAPGAAGNVLTSDGAGAWTSAPSPGGGGPPTGPAGGDLSGTYPDPTVAQLNLGALGYAPANLRASFGSDVDAYSQTVIQNTNSGSNASGVLVVSNDLGNDSEFYTDFGLTSSTYSNLFDTFPEQPNSAFLTANGGFGPGDPAVNLNIGVYRGSGSTNIIYNGGLNAYVVNTSGAFSPDSAFTGGVATTDFGTAGQVLTSAGNAAPPTWQAAGGGSIYPQRPAAWGSEYLWWKLDDAPQAGASPNVAANSGSAGAASLTATTNPTGGNSNGGAFYDKSPMFGVSGPFSAVSRFRGSGNTLQGADALYQGVSAFTLSAFANINESGGAFTCNVVTKKHPSGYSVGILTLNGRVYYLIRTAGGEIAYYTATNLLTYGLPNLLSMTYDGTTIRGYLNGQEVASGAQSGAIVWATGAGSEWEIGQISGGIERYDIWDVRAAPTVRSAAQLLADYKTGMGFNY